MLTFAKIIFIVVAGIFLVSFMQDSNFSLTGAGGFGDMGGPVPRGQYVASYDTNNDGKISNKEYERGELRRIETEIADLRQQLIEELEERDPSPYIDEIYLRTENAQERDADEEYLAIETFFNDEDDRVTITGWKLKSLASGKTVIIPKGIPPRNSAARSKDARSVSLRSGDVAIVSTGDYVSRERFERETNAFVEGYWMVFLENNRELWRNSSDAILLLDEHDRLVDSATY